MPLDSASTAALSAAGPNAPDLAAYSAPVFGGLDVPEPAPLLGPALVRGGIALVTGPRSVGKSWLALSLALAASEGAALLGWAAARPARVVYMDAAMPQGALRQRLAALSAGRDLPAGLTIVAGDAQVQGFPDLATEAGRDALDRLVTGAEAVVLDGLGLLLRAGPGAASRWAALSLWLRSLRRRGVAVLLTEAVEPRALGALADTHLRLSRVRSRAAAEGHAETGLHLDVEVTTRLFGGTVAQGFDAKLVLADGAALWSRLEDSDSEALIALRLSEAGHSMRKLAESWGVSPATICRMVQRARARTYGAAPQAAGAPAPETVKQPQAAQACETVKRPAEAGRPGTASRPAPGGWGETVKHRPDASIRPLVPVSLAEAAEICKAYAEA